MSLCSLCTFNAHVRDYCHTNQIQYIVLALHYNHKICRFSSILSPVLLPLPLSAVSEPVVVLTVTSPNTPPYYAGTQLVMSCNVVAQRPNEQTASAVIYRNGVPVNEAVVSSTATGVESVLTLSPLTMTAEYKCRLVEQ